MKSTISLLGSFKGLEPGGLELMIRKWKRELERGREREKERKKDTGTQALMDKGALLAEMQAYISLVRWLLSYYTGWNFINSHNMDSLINTRSLTLKRVTACLILWPQSWELRAALPVLGIGTDKEQRILEKWHTKEEKCNILDSLKLNVPWQFPLFYFFIIGGDCRYFSEKGPDQMSLLSLNNFSWKPSV